MLSAQDIGACISAGRQGTPIFSKLWFQFVSMLFLFTLPCVFAFSHLCINLWMLLYCTILARYVEPLERNPCLQCAKQKCEPVNEPRKRDYKLQVA
jgi:hypothetical protein